MLSVNYKKDKFRAKFVGRKVINLDKKFKESDSSDYFSDEGTQSESKKLKGKINEEIQDQPSAQKLNKESTNLEPSL